MNIKYYQANVLSVVLCLFLLIVSSFYFISDVEEDKIIQRNGLRTLESLESVASITARR